MQKYGKVARNAEIRRLWSVGDLSQAIIGERYGLTQARVSAIIYNRGPMYHYCRWCKARITASRSICQSCRENRITAVTERKERLVLQRSFLKHLKRYARNRARIADGLAAVHRPLVRKAKWVFLANTCAICKKEEPFRMSRYNFESKHVRTGIPVRTHLCWECNQKLRPFLSQGRTYARECARIRDNYTCQDCGLVRTRDEVTRANAALGPKLQGRFKSLDVHHLNGLCGMRTRGCDSIKDLADLITVCHRCHYRRHDFSAKGRASFYRKRV